MKTKTRSSEPSAGRRNVLQLTAMIRIAHSEKGGGMGKKPELNSWSSKQAVAILAVDCIDLSDYGHDVLKRIEDGHVTHEQAKEEILRRAREKISATKE